MAQIKVTRKAYVRKDGTMVKGTSYYTKDKGKPGKTPGSEKWYQHNVEMNWHKDEPAEVRRANALKAVSYTHLRAHETRHDLVCRLLLEKKKQKKKKTTIRHI